MKRKFFLVCILFYSKLITAQPSIEWQQSFGGSDYDIGGNEVEQTIDGGYVFIGSAFANSGQITGNHGGYDYWVIKTDPNGNLLWQKSYGGMTADHGKTIRQTANGGYVMAGAAASNDQDVSGNHGQDDLWVVRTDAFGNIEWQKCLGGSGSEVANCIRPTSDGGYIIAGSTSSVDGDVTGNNGNEDYWIVKIDSLGNLLWQNCFGGTLDEYATHIEQTPDQGFIVSGNAFSQNGDVIGNHGSYDAWILKLDSFGSIQWQRCLGGTFGDYAGSTIRSSDGNYVFCGRTSSNDGDVSGNHAVTWQDLWVVKLDPFGTILWQYCYGGTADDGGESIYETLDGGFIASGYSNSNDGDVSNHYGPPFTNGDYWAVKLDENGLLEWQRSLGGTSHDYSTSIRQTSDNGFIVAGSSSSTDFDVSGNQGDQDYWIAKLYGRPVAQFYVLSQYCQGWCVSFPDGSSGLITSWEWHFPGAVPDISSLQNPTNICFNSSGSHTIELIVSGPGGSDTSSTSINVIPAPPAPVSGGDQSICTGQSIPTLTVSVGTGEAVDWYDSPTGGSVLQYDSTSYTPLDSGTYYAQSYINFIGCQSLTRTAVTITINPNPTVNISGTTTICSNSSSTFDAGGGFAGYDWSTGETTQTINVTTAQNYSVEVTDGNGCTATDSEDLIVNAEATVTAGTDQTICPGTEAQLNGSFGGGASYAVWTSSGTGTFDNTSASNANYTPSFADTSGSVTLTFTTDDPPNLCPAVSASMTLNFYPLPQADITTTPSACGLANGTATISPTGGGGSFTFLWSDNQTGATATSLAAANYSVTMTDVNSCTAFYNVTVSNVSGPTAYENHTDVSCFGGNNGTATVNATGGTGSYTYAWAPNVSTGATATGLDTGIYIVTVTDGAACIATVSITINEPPMLVASAGNDIAICIGNDSLIGNPASGGTPGYSYSWNTSIALSDSTIATPIVDPGFTTTFIVTVTDTNGCTATDDITVTVNPLPDISISITSVICAGSPVSFGVTGGINYLWSNGETGQTADSVFSIPGLATFSATGTDANGCVNSDDTTFMVNSLPIIVVTQFPSGDLCQGSAVQFTASNAISYVWNQDQSAGTIDTIINNPGNNSVWVIGTDGNSCSDTGFASINILSLPEITNIISSNPTSCILSDGSITLQGLIAGSSYVVHFTLPDLQDSVLTITADGSGNILLNNLDAGTYSNLFVQLVSNGCNSDSLPAISLQDVGAPATAVSTDSITVCAGGAINLQLIGVSGTTYIWNGPSGFTSTQHDPVLLNADTTMTGSYIVTQTDTSTLCTGSASVDITVSLPHVNILATPNPSCSGSTVQVSSEDQGLNTYLWSNGSSSSSFQIVLFSDSVILLTGTDSIGCMRMDSETLFVNPVFNPSVNIETSFSTDTICSGASVTFIAQASDTASGTTCQWFLNGDTIAGATLWEFTTSSLLNGDVLSVQIQSPDPCATGTSSQRTIHVIGQPVIGGTAFANPSCGQADGNITLSGFASNTVYLVAFYFNSVADSLYVSSNSSGAIFLADLAAGIYSEFSVGIGSCFSDPLSGTINLFNNIGPPSVSVDDNSLCSGDSLVLHATGLSTATFQWTGPPASGFNSTSSDPVVFPVLASGNYCAIQDTNGCISAPSCVLVTVYPRPIVSITPPYSAVCAGQADTLIAEGADTYLWETGDTAVTLILQNLFTTQDIFVIGTNQYGCKDTATAYIQVNEGLLPDQILLDSSYIPHFQLNDTMCSGISFFAIGVDDPDGFVVYNWSILQGTDTITDFELSPDQSSMLFSPPSASTNVQYQVHLFAASSPQCTVDLSLTLTVLAGSTLPEPAEIWDHVVNGKHTLVCLDKTADHYQWGYDDKFSWMPHELPGETFQDYFIGFVLDTNNRYYWVKSYYGECYNKTYFNCPPPLSPCRTGSTIAWSGETSVYPNPGDGLYMLTLNRKVQGRLEIEIYNGLGQLVQQKEYDASQVTNAGIPVNLTSFPDGIYFMKVRDEVTAYLPLKLLKTGSRN